MEKAENKSGKIINRIVTGLVILLIGAYFLIVPNMISFYAPGKAVCAVLCVLAMLLIYNAAATLYAEDKNKKTKALMFIALIGMVLFAIMAICWSYFYLSNSENANEFIIVFNFADERDSLNLSPVWIRRIRSFYILVLFNYLFVLICSIFNSLISVADLDKGQRKKIRIIEIVNGLSYVSCGCFILGNLDIDSVMFFQGTLAMVYLIWLCMFIRHMKEYVYIPDVSDSGSIFNRIPEDEYQEFLEKMK